MINANELRMGNYVLHKVANKVSKVQCSYAHFQLLAAGDAASFYPVILNPDVLEQCGFVENKEYSLLPTAREFIIALPVMGSNKNEIYAYVKNNKECFARVGVNGLVASNNFYHLHSLQNVYFALTGEELIIKS